MAAVALDYWRLSFANAPSAPRLHASDGLRAWIADVPAFSATITCFT
jgi:hypothetical protein